LKIIGARNKFIQDRYLSGHPSNSIKALKGYKIKTLKRYLGITTLPAACEFR